MKRLIFITLFLSGCWLSNAQDYLKDANACFDKGDYECAKRNYTLWQELDGRDMSIQIQKADECLKALFAADNYFKDKEYRQAQDRYKATLATAMAGSTTSARAGSIGVIHLSITKHTA